MEHKASVRFAFEARAQSVRTASDFARGRLQRSNKQHADIFRCENHGLVQKDHRHIFESLFLMEVQI